jgi:hypothetical protein
MADYAILLAITWYPGLTELKGPENDVDDFKQWLCAPEGGNLVEGKPDGSEFPDSAKSAIRVIRSSDFPREPNPYRAQPAEAAFREALNRLLFEPDGVTFRNKVGGRLYLYFAGHGFSGKRLAEAALYTAQARKNDPDHIASKRYAERIANSDAFDEIVLVMDCCRDVDLSDAIRDPTMKLPDRQGIAAKVRLLEAYGAGRGQQARERDLDGSGIVRGLFTHAFVDALRNAPGDAGGNVTGERLKRHVNNRWPQFFAGEPPYYPDIFPPGGAEEIVLVRRTVAPTTEVRFFFAAPEPAVGSMIVVYDTHRNEVARVAFDPVSTMVRLPDGLYTAKLDGTLRSRGIDVSGAFVTEIL